MIKKCCGNDVAAFAKLSHVTLYARTATDGNMSVVVMYQEFVVCNIAGKVSLP